MAYSDFTLAKAKQAFGLTLEELPDLFAKVPGVTPSAFLTQTLAENTFLATAIGTEKARSERFLRLQEQVVQIDLTEYFLSQVPQILGILLEPFQPTAISIDAG